MITEMGDWRPFSSLHKSFTSSSPLCTYVKKPWSTSSLVQVVKGTIITTEMRMRVLGKYCILVLTISLLSWVEAVQADLHYSLVHIELTFPC